jgi:hypothetical protein
MTPQPAKEISLFKLREGDLPSILPYFDQSAFHFLACGARFLPERKLLAMLGQRVGRLYLLHMDRTVHGVFYHGPVIPQTKRCYIEYAFLQACSERELRARCLRTALAALADSRDLDSAYSYVYEFDPVNRTASEDVGMEHTGGYEQRIFYVGRYWDLLLFHTDFRVFERGTSEGGSAHA